MSIEEAIKDLKSYQTKLRIVREQEEVISNKQNTVKGIDYSKAQIQISSSGNEKMIALVREIEKLREKLTMAKVKASMEEVRIRFNILNIDSPYGDILECKFIKNLSDNSTQKFLRKTINYHYSERQYYRHVDRAIEIYAEIN